MLKIVSKKDYEEREKDIEVLREHVIDLVKENEKLKHTIQNLQKRVEKTEEEKEKEIEKLKRSSEANKKKAIVQKRKWLHGYPDETFD